MSFARLPAAGGTPAGPNSVWAKAKCVVDHAASPHEPLPPQLFIITASGARFQPSCCCCCCSGPCRQHGALGFNGIARNEAEELANRVAALEAQVRGAAAVPPAFRQCSIGLAVDW